MSESGESAQPVASQTALTRRVDAEEYIGPPDPQVMIDWVTRNWILLGGIVLIAVQVAWKAQFLSHLYFRQDDFHDLDLAIQNPFNLHYLTYIGSGHLIIGLRVVAWLMVRTSLYNWGQASAISMIFVAAAGVAALRLLRTLFGDRPAILLPLTFYLLVPLTLPDLGDWSSAMESVPLQLAIFMALTAHVYYIRTGRPRHLAAAISWTAFGMLFFEKGLVLPPLLFAATAGFLVGGGSLAVGMRLTLSRFWRAWLLYAVLMVGYTALLVGSLRTSGSQPAVPNSAGHLASFSVALVRQTLLPGLVGGPWRWLPISGGSFALAEQPGALTWLSALIVALVAGVSIWFRRVAWRAWAILAGWVAFADLLPVIIGRINQLSASLLALETRYLADAMPVAAICLGLAFLPVAAPPGSPALTGRGAWLRPDRAQQWSLAIAALTGVFAAGSIWSAQAYESATTGKPAATYIANASLVIRQAPRGTRVYNGSVPAGLVLGIFGTYAYQSTVIGDLRPGRVRWIRHPDGTIDGLLTFGPDGRLYRAYVYGAPSAPRPAGGSCWPVRNGQIVVQLRDLSPPFTWMVRIGYFWYSRVPATVAVAFGNTAQALVLQPGLHAAYMPVSERGQSITITNLPRRGLCIGDAEAGHLRPVPGAVVLPHIVK